MPKPPKSQEERRADAAAERRIHGAALGYQPMRMKPVHFATNFLLGLTGRYSDLELLNKASVPRATPKPGSRIPDEYVADVLYPKLRELNRLSDGIDLASFRILRAHLNAGFNNDGAALSPAFAPHKPFGADYSAPSTVYLTNFSKNHGHSGSFVLRILSASDAGRGVLDRAREILTLPAPPLDAFGRPLLDEADKPWVDDYDDRFGTLEPHRAEAIAQLMEAQTRALDRLLTNLIRQKSVYALRYMIIGVCVWLFAYMMRLRGQTPLLLLDALDGRNSRIRAHSRASYARQLDRFSQSYDQWRATAGVEDLAEGWTAFTTSTDARQTLEDHFRDLGVRIGVIQPRAPAAKRKHAELQADTLRVLALSLMAEHEVITIVEFAQRLRQVWSLCSGADPDDGERLRDAGLGPLDMDEDLEPNGAAFGQLMVRLGLAVEPSDGLTLCALRTEDLI